MADESRVVRPRGSVHEAFIDGEVVLWDEATARVHHLNPTAGVVWVALDGRATVGEVVDDVAAEYSAPSEAVGAGVMHLLAELEKAELVESSDVRRSRQPARPPSRPRYLVDPPGD